MNKKIIVFTLMLLSILTLSACNDKDKTDHLETQIKNMTSLELVEHMGNGTNLGNTMEAWGRDEAYLGTDSEVSAYETFWGQPVTTPEMIQGMKDSGFDSLRIPVAWTNTMNFESGDYTISEAYLERVGQIIQYAFDADMYVVINDHWDGGWWGMFGSKTESVRLEAMELYRSMWTQIANYYKDYSYRLIFESANEELGDRLNDRDIATDSGFLDTDALKYAKTNEINQAFVDVIRSTGGKNSDRFLLIAGFNTDIEHTVSDLYIMPTDTAEHKLLISVHYYNPWTYVGTSGVSRWGTEREYEVQNELFAMMTKFTDLGYGVIIGEYGVLPMTDGSMKHNVVEYTKNVLDNCDKYGYVPMLWDTSSFYLRTSLSFVDANLLALFQSRNNEQYVDLTKEEIILNAETSMEAALLVARQNDEEQGHVIVEGDSIAWIMFTDAAWSTSYSVGDAYTPTSKTDGIINVDLDITGEGTYTISLDFTGTLQGYANGVGFSAIGISYGEINFPGYVIQITSLLINGEPYNYTGIPFTTSDDQITTRLNLYNQWVSSIPEEARTFNPNLLQFATAMILNANALTEIYTISVTFNYVNPNE